MGRFSAILLSLLSLGAVFDAQAATLKGLVLADELGGPPLAGVEIAATEGDIRAVTDAAGAFVLAFPDKNAGDTVKLIVGREGYEVVNDIQLESPLAEEGESGTLVLLLCRQGNREEMTRRMALLMARQAIEANYRGGLKELEKQKDDALTGLSDLRRRLMQAEASVESIARTLAKRGGERPSWHQRQAMRFFLQGKLERAIAVLDRRVTEPSDEDANPTASEPRNEPEEAGRDQQLKGQLLTLALRFNDADTAYQAALASAPDDFEANITYANFLRSVGRGDEAKSRTLRCLELARKTGSAISRPWPISESTR